MRLSERVRHGALHPAEIVREVHRRDLGYGGVLTCGAILAGAFALNWLPTDSWAWLALEWVYRLPILFLFAAAALLAAGFAVAARHELRLVVLAAATLLAPVVPWLRPLWPAAADPALAAFFSLYAIVAVVLPARWLLVDRRRLLARFPPPVDAGW